MTGIATLVVLVVVRIGPEKCVASTPIAVCGHPRRNCGWCSLQVDWGFCIFQCYRSAGPIMAFRQNRSAIKAKPTCWVASAGAGVSVPSVEDSLGIKVAPLRAKHGCRKRGHHRVSRTRRPVHRPNHWQHRDSCREACRRPKRSRSYSIPTRPVSEIFWNSFSQLSHLGFPSAHELPCGAMVAHRARSSFRNPFCRKPSLRIYLRMRGSYLMRRLATFALQLKFLRGTRLKLGSRPPFDSCANDSRLCGESRLEATCLATSCFSR
jgi:hypothetical protein